MPTSASGVEDRFVQVSSLYGPGTIAAWYFTILSVFVSWTLHPRKWKSGSIDVNLVAILTLPAVAAGHVIWQGQLLPGRMTDVSDEGLIQLIAAIEAPFIVTETFMAVSVILFLVSAWTYCIRRAILVALIGVECLTVESYVHFSIQLFHYRPGTLAKNFPAFSRLFVADFIGLLIAIIVVLGLLIVITGLLTMVMLFNSKESSSPGQDIERSSQPHRILSDGENSGSGDAVSQSMPPIGTTTAAGRSVTMAEARQLGMRTNRLPWSDGDRGRPLLPITLFSTLLLPLSFIATLWPSFWHSTSYFTVTANDMSLWNRIKDAVVRFGREFFPRTASSITDLDQAVAAVAGAMALAFSIYSVAKAYYKIWNV